MAQFTAAQIEEHGKKILDELEDGLSWTDVGFVVAEGMKIAEAVSGMTGEEKKQAVIAVANYVFDETDFPWLPDSLVDPILKQAVPWIIELVIDASKGNIVNK
jgi:hypothetical protein